MPPTPAIPLTPGSPKRFRRNSQEPLTFGFLKIIHQTFGKHIAPPDKVTLFHMSLKTGGSTASLIRRLSKDVANSQVLSVESKMLPCLTVNTGTLNSCRLSLRSFLKHWGKPGARRAFTCQEFCWHNHGWPEAAWRCRRAWHLDGQVPLSFGGLHLGVAVHSQKPPQADSLLHVLKQIRNKGKGEGWLEPVT